jgi:hypothetical protein
MTVQPGILMWSSRQDRFNELESLAKPLLDSPAFHRLNRLTFLGILSPRFATKALSPLWNSSWFGVADGTRRDHSLGVAITALELARLLGLSSITVRYAAAWGLTHDIATWPLSHTGEAAFRSITGTSSQEVREAILRGSEQIPRHYCLDRFLRLMDLQPETLLNLFQKDSLPPSAELALLKQVIHSPLTPDTLEGAWRGGAVFGIPVPSPADMLPCFIRHEKTVCLNGNHLGTVADFWNRKAEMYHRFINRQEVILWESAWSLAIKRECEGWSLADSLDAQEDVLVARILATGLPKCSHVVRYKKPQEYVVNGSLEMLHDGPSLSELWRVLKRRPMEVPSNG